MPYVRAGDDSVRQGRCAWCGIWLKAELKSENKRGIPDQAYRARFAGASAIAPQLERNREELWSPARETDIKNPYKIKMTF
jgi:hypothetical protein